MGRVAERIGDAPDAPLRVEPLVSAEASELIDRLDRPRNTT